MPFDSAGHGDPLAVQMIDLITAFFWDGACWTRGEMHDEYGKRCLVGAMRYIRAQTGISATTLPPISAGRCMRNTM